MDGEANLPVLPAPTSTKSNLIRSTISDFSSRSFTSSSSSLSSSFYLSSPPDLVRHVQAAFKRHRPLGAMQSNNIRPRRILVSQRETSKSLALNKVPTVGAKETKEGSVVGETQEDASTTPTTPSSLLGTITSRHEEKFKPSEVQRDQLGPITGCKNSDAVSSFVAFEHVPLVERQKKVHFAAENTDKSQEIEWDVSNQVEASTGGLSHDLKYQNFHNAEVDIDLRSGGGISSLLAKRTIGVQDQLQQFGNILRSDLSHSMTQSSVVGSSCATTTLNNTASAPILNSTTYCSHLHQISSSHVDVESLGDCVKSQPVNQRDVVQPSHPSFKYISGVLAGQTTIAAQALSSAANTELEVKEYDMSKEQQNSELKESDIPKDPPPLDDKSSKGKGLAGDVTDVQSQVPLSKNPSPDVMVEPSKSDKQEKVASGKATSAARKRNYDPDLFFKVNGKLYQRLGKIGTGGSSEVHKVISSDCTIYALKKIKLKGRDYATAYGFCQEIEYLNKLKRKNNIIQLIDYEVTDKTLLQEVMNGSMNNKDGRVKGDAYIYMVLEYGEIDLAHMLSQKWKELDSSLSIIDDNWLRFYWQQILLAVNTIHEERIVHSDLKPANFLLVGGSLKLIDFGIAKAIMSDTTHIQRDSQVGTLSYMSPEAFMCNETDANGSTIKCGRPSDIWSLGCILYQMVYGRTPFSEYKTFWAKFKVITDTNHEIIYEPVSNPWLLDLMKKCLAWDLNERWRIPQLLQHPFLVPPIPAQLSPHQDQRCELLQLIVESCSNDRKASMLCGQLRQLLDPRPAVTSQISTSRDEPRKLLCEISNICFQLQEQLANSERD